MYYSAKTNGWYPPELMHRYIENGTLPDDIKEYPQEVYEEIVTHRPLGMVQVPDTEGRPSLAPVPAPTKEELEISVRAERDRLLVETVDTMSPIRWASLAETQKTEWIEYRQLLLDVPQQEGFPETVEWPKKPD